MSDLNAGKVTATEIDTPTISNSQNAYNVTNFGSSFYGSSTDYTAQGNAETGYPTRLNLNQSNLVFNQQNPNGGLSFIGYSSTGGYLGEIGRFKIDTTSDAAGMSNSLFTWGGDVNFIDGGGQVDMESAFIRNLTLGGGVQVAGTLDAQADTLLQGAVSAKKGITIAQSNLIGDLILDTEKLITSTTSDISANAGLSVLGDVSFSSGIFGGVS